ncbi:hypothetical protein MMC17_000314 [Xylographa soralifera]|nr:hypothetical protein [Xylographa soralifera]
MAFFSFLYRQSFVHPKPAPPTIDLSGYTVLVTGCNVGIGLEATRQIMGLKASRVIMAVRTMSKGESAKADLLRSNPGCMVEVWELNMDSFDSVLAFGRRAQSLDRLDMVLLNAGLSKIEFTTSADTGHETTVQVNHLATALLSLLLLSPLRATAAKYNKPSRMTITSSEVHMWTPFKEQSAPNILQRLDEKSAFPKPPDRYNVSKLLNVLWTRELASKIKAKDIVINTVNPGLCHSSLHRDDNSAGLKYFKKIFARTTEEGGRIIVDAAAVESAKTHGGYLSEQKMIPPSSWVRSVEGAKIQHKLWDETMDLFQAEVPSADVKNCL